MVIKMSGQRMNGNVFRKSEKLQIKTKRETGWQLRRKIYRNSI